MSTFIENAILYARKSGFNLIRVAEIDHGDARFGECNRGNPCQNIYSVAKAFTMTAIGIICDRELLTVDEKVTDIFADSLPENMDKRWHDVTVDHLLTHRAGLHDGQLDIDCIDINTFDTDDFLDLTLRTELLYDPGTDSAYSDAAYYMLSRILTAKTGEKLDDFLWRELFRPCGFREAAWSKCPHGYPMGATGLYIYAEDMAKLGQIYLDGGVYNGKRILSEDWVNFSLMRPYEFTPRGFDTYGKGGMRGQMLLVIPEKRRVVAWTACDDGDTTELRRLAAESE